MVVAAEVFHSDDRLTINTVDVLRLERGCLKCGVRVGDAEQRCGG